MTNSSDHRKARSFDDKPALRERVPLLVGLVGPSGGGKTYSALRLATGVQRVTGGDIYFIDTEARRALHYADRFRFRHLSFGAPFGSLDYLDAIQHCVSKGAKTIIVDSMSHEHEGPGGMLEAHERECERLMAAWKKSREVVQMTAWAKPKAERRRLINSILQLPCNFIFCFRAKEKLKIKRGEDPKQLGFMPIAGEEFVFEMTVNCLLMPGANGVPTWHPDEDGEKRMIKLPAQFRDLLSGTGNALSEDIGEQLAKWAEGAAIDGGQFSEIRDAIALAGDLDVLKLVKPRLDEVKAKKSLPPGQYNVLIEAMKERKAELERAAAEAPKAGDDFDPSSGELREDPPLARDYGDESAAQ